MQISSFKSAFSKIMATSKSNGNSIVVLGSILIVMTWIVAHIKLQSDNEAKLADACSDLTNLSLLFEQDVLRTTTDLDRTLKYLRRMQERSAAKVDWPALVTEEFAANSRTAQIAVIDADGMMITSSADLRPKMPINLSDREHYLFHRDHAEDVLHVSKPLIGRASGKWSVQFTRRFAKPDGTFGGVIVISLDPSRFMTSYGKLQALHAPGFAVVRSDSVILAGAGFYAASMGTSRAVENNVVSVASKSQELQLNREYKDGSWRLHAERTVSGTDLSVLISSAYPIPVDWNFWHSYYAYAALLSIAAVIVVARSTRRQRQYVHHITTLAHIDTLTGLPNRLSFQNMIADSMRSEAGRTGFSLHLIDLDKFKAVNDTFGHPVGDELLRQVAARMTHSVRTTDHVFRHGGDEFALIQTDCTEPKQADTVARRLCSSIAEPFVISGHPLHIGASIGIAFADAGITDPSALLKAADIALYLAKEEGRGTHRFHNDELALRLETKQRLEVDLRVAIEKCALDVHYQPKVLLADPSKIVGYEALLRWHHPERGMISPAEFIPLAEETGLIVPLGEWMLQEVCAEFKKRPDRECVAVNCSAVQFRTSNVSAMVTRCIVQHGLDPARLEIEITESMLMRDDATIMAQLFDLRTLGVRISLDDFGTGFSSLSYLQTYPIDCIKIDRSFVAKIGVEPRAAPIVRAIIVLGAELNMTTIAEGVETVEQAACLAALGCEMAQGYLYGKPMAARELWPDRKALSCAA